MPAGPSSAKSESSPAITVRAARPWLPDSSFRSTSTRQSSASSARPTAATAQTNFALPNLTGQTMIGPGQGPGLSQETLGAADRLVEHRLDQRQQAGRHRRFEPALRRLPAVVADQLHHSRVRRVSLPGRRRRQQRHDRRGHPIRRQLCAGWLGVLRWATAADRSEYGPVLASSARPMAATGRLPSRCPTCAVAPSSAPRACRPGRNCGRPGRR